MALTPEQRIKRLEEAVFGPGGTGESRIKKIAKAVDRILDKVEELQREVLPGMDAEIAAIRLELKSIIDEAGDDRFRGGISTPS